MNMAQVVVDHVIELIREGFLLVRSALVVFVCDSAEEHYELNILHLIHSLSISDCINNCHH